MLGDNIKRLMRKNGYTQKELAIRSGCSECSISRYLNNDREPNVKSLKNIAIALGVTVDDLLKEENEKVRCGECIHYCVCDPYVSPNESFPEVDGGCGCFKSASDFAPKSEVDKLKIEIEALKIANEKMYAANKTQAMEIFEEIEEDVLDFPMKDSDIHIILDKGRYDKLKKKYTDQKQCPNCRYFVGCEKAIWVGVCDEYEVRNDDRTGD